MCAPSTSCRPPSRSSTAAQTLVYRNAAYQRLWQLDPAFLAQSPTDGEVLDRLRAAAQIAGAGRFPRLEGGRARQPITPSSRARPGGTCPTGARCASSSNPNPQGGVTYLFDDVSEQVQLESQVTALTRVQSETLDTLKEGVAVFGTDGRLKLSNRAFREMWQLHAGGARRPSAYRRGDPRAAVCSRPRTSPGPKSRGAVAGLADMRLGLTCRMERRDGSAIDCTALPLPDGATLLTFVDVTASVNVERALTERNEALERASRLRDDFVHHVSYELRSPLTNIIGFTQLLGDETVGALNPRQREYAVAHHALLRGAARDPQRHSRSRLDRHRIARTRARNRRHPIDDRGGDARPRGPARGIDR